MKVDLPIKYFYKNLAIGESHTWAFYRLPDFYYDFLSDYKKEQKMLQQAFGFMGIKVEFHLLLFSVEQEIERTNKEYEAQITGELAEVAYTHNERLEKRLKEWYGSSRRSIFYLGVKLLPYDPEDIIQALKFGFYDFKKAFFGKANLHVLKEEENRQYIELEKQVYKRLYRSLRIERIDTNQAQFIIEHNFSRGIRSITPERVSRTYLEGKYIIEEKEVKRLCEGLIDDSGMDYIKLDKDGKTTYMGFLCVSYFEYEMQAVGNEFIYHLQEIDFPVDMSIRARVNSNKKSREKVENKKGEVEAEIDFALDSNHKPSKETVENEEELDELEYDLKKSKIPLFETSVVFCVYADSLELMRQRVTTLKDEYKANFEMVLEQPHGDQMLLFDEFLAGSEMKVEDYTHVLEPNFLASGMFGATKELGDPYGIPIGTTGVNQRIVYFNPRLQAQGLKGAVTNSLSVNISGATGWGKSFLVNLLMYYIALWGGRILLFDPKGERAVWLEYFDYFGKQLNIVTLYANEEYRGMLDPWNLTDGKEAQELAISIITELLREVAPLSTNKFVSKAVKAVGAEENPCMLKVVDYLLNSDNKEERSVGEDIQAFDGVSFAVLLFGDGKPVKTINLKSAMNILQIQNLSLPKKDKNIKDYTPANRLSVALMTPITTFAKKFIHDDRSVLKIFVNEESWATMESSQGSEVSEIANREGRSLNSGIYYVGQDVSYLDENIMNNIGVKFAFRCDNIDVAKNVLDFLGMEKTESNVDLLLSLELGQCVMKDMWGRIGIVNVEHYFEDLFEAWNTKPPERREDEEE